MAAGTDIAIDSIAIDIFVDRRSFGDGWGAAPTGRGWGWFRFCLLCGLLSFMAAKQTSQVCEWTHTDRRFRMRGMVIIVQQC